MPSQHRVIGPDHELVLPVRGEPTAIMLEILLEGGQARPGDGGDDVGIDTIRPVDHVVHTDRRHRFRVSAVGVDEEDWMKDLNRLVGVEARMNLRDERQVAVDEARKSRRVLDGASPGGTADIELELRQAEGVLHIDEPEPHAKIVLRARANSLRPGPLTGVGGAPRVVDSEESPRIDGVVMLRKR